MSASYTPASGGSLLVVDNNRAVLLAQDGGAAERAEELLRALGADDAVAAVLEVLMRGGLSAMPAFGFAELDGGAARLLVRGTVSASAGGQTFSGGEYSTWGEHRVRDAADIELVVESAGQASTDSGSIALPLDRGAVLATRVGLTAGAAVGSASPAADSSAPQDSAADSAAAPVVAPTSGLLLSPPLISPPNEVNTPAVAASSLAEDGRRDEPMTPAPASPVAPAYSAPPAPAQTTAEPSTPGRSTPEQSTGPVVASQTNSGHDVASQTVGEQTIVEYTRADADPGYSHLFEETIVRPIEHAAVREETDDDGGSGAGSAPSYGSAPVTTPTPVAAPESDLAEHDGLTIVSGDLAKLRAEAAAGGTAFGEGTGGAFSSTAPIATPKSAPAQTELHFSNGTVETLAGLVIVGRSPSSGKVSAGRVPRLVTIDDDPDMSRSHVQFELQGGAVVVTDLHSRNGTSVVLPGRSPERLRGGVPTTVIDGAIVDLGGGVTITVHEAAEDAR